MTEKRKLTREELDQWWKSLSPEQKKLMVRNHKMKEVVQHHLNLIKERKLNNDKQDQQ